MADGLLVTLDYLGEDTVDPEQATAVTEEYVALLEPAGRGRPDRAAAGPRSRSSRPRSDSGCASTARRPPRRTSPGSAPRPAAAGTTVTVDMEDHTRVEPTLRSWSPSSGRTSPTSAA